MELNISRSVIDDEFTDSENVEYLCENTLVSEEEARQTINSVRDGGAITSSIGSMIITDWIDRRTNPDGEPDNRAELLQWAMLGLESPSMMDRDVYEEGIAHAC